MVTTGSLPTRTIVAPFAGAWIEILAVVIRSPQLKSLPSRERGLKSEAAFNKETAQRSLPSRERGLK